MKYKTNTDIIGTENIPVDSEVDAAQLKAVGLTDARIAEFVARGVLTELGAEAIVAEEVAVAGKSK